MQLDFSIPENLAEFRDLVHRMVGDEPVLYSLLGNTMANFDHDAELLAGLTGWSGRRTCSCWRSPPPTRCPTNWPRTRSRSTRAAVPTASSRPAR
ncbi:hypothetical protein K7G98_16375 [Saccharothrix sp. MB29]|nr:hypothetical protein [Saccharothrix sp. MB29]